MDNNLPIQEESLLINSHELLVKFILAYTNEGKNTADLNKETITCANTVSAIYYFRKFPNVEDFINNHLKINKDYFMIQWIRSTWAKYAAMTSEELSDLVINQLTLVDNSEEG